jgi:hypothetical protein
MVLRRLAHAQAKPKKSDSHPHQTERPTDTDPQSLRPSDPQTSGLKPRPDRQTDPQTQRPTYLLTGIAAQCAQAHVRNLSVAMSTRSEMRPIGRIVARPANILSVPIVGYSITAPDQCKQTS